MDLATLDVSYVSSLSWYFLVMFGMSKFYSLILGDGNAADMNEAKMMQVSACARLMAPPSVIIILLLSLFVSEAISERDYRPGWYVYYVH